MGKDPKGHARELSRSMASLGRMEVTSKKTIQILHSGARDEGTNRHELGSGDAGLNEACYRDRARNSGENGILND
jgi:hypothetical protein